MSRDPVFIPLDAEDEHRPDTAPPVPDLTPDTRATAMQQAASVLARPRSALSKWFWSVLGAVIVFTASVAAWEFTLSLIARSPVLGGMATALFGLFGLILLIIAIKELAAFARLKRLDVLQDDAARALETRDLAAARVVVAGLERLYAGREDTSWGRSRLAERGPEQMDADALLALAETDLLAPLDAAAVREVEAAARQVATVTAVVPLALADLFAALTSNLRMIRRIAEIYGGRSGTLGSWRLTRAVFSHLVATGAVAVGDDLIGSVAGGGVLSRVSRRFGEGVVNGALTARVGVAALEVCRPMPFRAVKRPSVTTLVRNALAGLFGGSKG